MSLIKLPSFPGQKKRPPRVDQCILHGVSFGKIGPRGELGMAVLLKDTESGQGIKLGRQLRQQEFLMLREKIDKVLAGIARDATKDSEIV